MVFAASITARFLEGFLSMLGRFLGNKIVLVLLSALLLGGNVVAQDRTFHCIGESPSRMVQFDDISGVTEVLDPRLERNNARESYRKLKESMAKIAGAMSISQKKALKKARKLSRRVKSVSTEKRCNKLIAKQYSSLPAITLDGPYKHDVSTQGNDIQLFGNGFQNDYSKPKASVLFMGDDGFSAVVDAAIIDDGELMVTIPNGLSGVVSVMVIIQDKKVVFVSNVSEIDLDPQPEEDSEEDEQEAEDGDDQVEDIGGGDLPEDVPAPDDNEDDDGEESPLDVSPPAPTPPYLINSSPSAQYTFTEDAPLTLVINGVDFTPDMSVAVLITGVAEPVNLPFTFISSTQFSVEIAPINKTVYFFAANDEGLSNALEMVFIDNIPSYAGAEEYFGDTCSAYYMADVDKPVYVPSFKQDSMLMDPLFYRRDLSNLDSAKVRTVCSSGCTDDRVRDAVNNANPGDTILVAELSGNEQTKILIKNAHFPDDNPVHIYFVQPMTLGPLLVGGEWTLYLDRASNILIDGMNNLKIIGPTDTASYAGLGWGPGNQSDWSVVDVRRVVFKHIDIDGSHIQINAEGIAEYFKGLKWGVKSNGGEDVAMCDVNVRNTRDEHSVYINQHTGILEIVQSTLEMAGRTCFQYRASGQSSPYLKILLENNICRDSRDASAITISDLSGQAIVTNNQIERVRGVFVSQDSHGGTNPQFDHSMGQFYIFNNEINFGEMPLYGDLSPYSGPYRTFLISDYMVFDYSKGPEIFFENNKVSHFTPTQKSVFNINLGVCDGSGSPFYSNNNEFNLKYDSVGSKGEYNGTCATYNYGIDDWQNIMSLDLDSDFTLNPDLEVGQAFD